jgi:hypothetical protein
LWKTLSDYTLDISTRNRTEQTALRSLFTLEAKCVSQMDSQQKDRVSAVNVKLMRVRRFAAAADMAPSSIYSLLKKGAIRGVKVGSSLRIPASELERLERGEVTA